MFQKLRRNLERNLFGKDPHYQDPYNDPAEQYYARIYLKYLFEKIDVEFRHQQVKILDLGCHTGRLAVPLARASHVVTGIDSSRFHILRAREHAREAGVRCQFFSGDGFSYVRRVPPETFDLVLCTEVLYQRPDFRSCMEKLFKAVRKGGLLATSHRTRFFYLSRAIREKDFQTAQSLSTPSEGTLWNSYYNWQTPSELRAIYQDLGAEAILLRPIGVFTGNGGDGMACLCNLAEMTASEQREALFDIEAQDSEEFAGIGRYLFAVGRKTGA